MKKLRSLLITTIISLTLLGCTKTEKYQVDKPTTLKGTIVVNTITENGETKNISVLELDKEISINGIKTDKIEIEYDKSLKNNTETTITGTLKENSGDTDLKYSISVDTIDNILAYVNTFSNDIFSMAIPANLMKIVTVKSISNGFIVYSSNSSEAFKIEALTKEEYKNISTDDLNFDKIKSNNEYTIILIYPTGEDNSDISEEQQTLYNSIEDIKASVKIK